MMEFLDKIYGYEYFGIILFSVIMLLIVIFVIILCLGKKDEKKREIERTQQLEKQALEGFSETTPEPTTLEVNEPRLSNDEEIEAPLINEIPVVEEPVITPILEEVQAPVEPEIPEVAPVLEPIVEPSITPVTNTITDTSLQEESVATVVEPVIAQEVKLEPVEPTIDPIANEEPKLDIEIPEFNFDELAASIANELNALEDAEKVVEENKPVETPIVNEDVPVTPISEVVKSAIETPKPTTAPVTFSSVYINKPTEPVAPVAPVVEQTPVEAVVEPVVMPQQQPINPNIELPKPAEMPVLKENINSNPVNNPTQSVPDFSQFEGESYNLK